MKMIIKKQKQLGIHPSTAAAILRKKILFKLIKDTENDICFQCNKKIENIDELSIEHKKPWLDSEKPLELFFDLENIAFSHLKCNIGAGRKTKLLKHPSFTSYKRGCRCKECTEQNKIAKRKVRQKLNKTQLGG